MDSATDGTIARAKRRQEKAREGKRRQEKLASAQDQTAALPPPLWQFQGPVSKSKDSIPKLHDRVRRDTWTCIVDVHRVAHVLGFVLGMFS